MARAAWLGETGSGSAVRAVGRRPKKRHPEGGWFRMRAANEMPDGAGSDGMGFGSVAEALRLGESVAGYLNSPAAAGVDGTTTTSASTAGAGTSSSSPTDRSAPTARRARSSAATHHPAPEPHNQPRQFHDALQEGWVFLWACLLYTSDAADD